MHLQSAATIRDASKLLKFNVVFEQSGPNEALLAAGVRAGVFLSGGFTRLQVFRELGEASTPLDSLDRRLWGGCGCSFGI